MLRLRYGPSAMQLLAFLLVCGCTIDPASRTTVSESSGQPTGRVDVAHMASQLAGPIADCVVRVDTSHPVFHGCVDWHSAVHGNYALRAVSRLTGNPGYGQLAERTAAGAGMASEEATIRDGGLREEVPYGYSWFLILDAEAEKPEWSSVAGLVSSELRDWIDRGVEGNGHRISQDYENVSFAIFALYGWYVTTSRHLASDFELTVVPGLREHADEACAEKLASGFFDPCATLLLALSAIDLEADALIPDAELEDIYQVVARRPTLSLDDVRTVHAAGLNFSRSWALYAASMALDNAAAIDAGDRLFAAGFESSALWRHGYESYAHWVAQFGVHALDLRSRATLHLEQKALTRGSVDAGDAAGSAERPRFPRRITPPAVQGPVAGVTEEPPGDREPQRGPHDGDQSEDQVPGRGAVNLPGHQPSGHPTRTEEVNTTPELSLRHN